MLREHGEKIDGFQCVSLIRAVGFFFNPSFHRWQNSTWQRLILICQPKLDARIPGDQHRLPNKVLHDGMTNSYKMHGVLSR